MPGRPPDEENEWLPSGFPPRSFAPGAPAPPSPPRLRPARRRGRRLGLAAALVVAVLVLAVGTFLATRGDDGGSTLATSTSTSVLPDTSVPTLDSTSTTTVADTTTSIDGVSTTVAGATTSVVAVPATDQAAPGALDPSLFTVNLPRTDATAGVSRGPLSLRNVGGTALTYTTQSSSPGLSAAPARGTIQPGAVANLTVTLDAARIPTEGAFAGTLTFTSGGADKAVQVRSVTGRPPAIGDGVGEACPQPTMLCSRQIKLAPSSEPEPTPCNTPWLYSVTITDQSKIQTTNAIARRGISNADAALRRVGTSDVFLSDGFTPLPAGTVLRFTIEAVDELGFGRRLPEQTIAC